MPVLNDVHSRLNETRVSRLVRPRSVEQVVAAVRHATAHGLPVSICGGRHAMGGQQFVQGGLQVDLSHLNRLVDFWPDRRLVTVQAGMLWPGLLAALRDRQAGDPPQLTFRQKQTGADRLSIGGAVAANVHGRGLRFGPFVEDIESFVLVDPWGELRRCSRAEQAELFRLVIGGYGLFGTVRAIRMDPETFLPWAAGDRACVVFNLCVRHDPAGLAKAARDFRRILDRAVERGGGFYLTYHRWATPDQLLAAHPRFPAFLSAKLTADPEERFQSEWYRHWRELL